MEDEFAIVKACVYLIIIIFFTCFIWNLILDSSNYEYRDFEYSGIVTDKWTHQSWGGTIYRIEIGDYKTLTVDDSEYYNYEIGDSFYWTTSKLVDKETGEIVKVTRV